MSEDILVTVEESDAIPFKVPPDKLASVRKLLEDQQQRELLGNIVSLYVLDTDFRRLQTYMINNHRTEPNYVILATHTETKTIRPHLIGKKAKQMLADYCDIHFTKTRAKNLPKQFKEILSTFIMLFLREKGFRQLTTFVITRFKNKQSFIILTLENNQPKMGFIGDQTECKKIKDRYDTNIRKSIPQYFSSSDHY